MSERRSACELVVVAGPVAGAEYAVSGRMVIGRKNDCEIQLLDAGVSGHHSAIERDVDGALISDLGSSNGTFVNGALLQGELRLFDGDMIQVGNSVLSYRQQGPPQVVTDTWHATDSDVIERLTTTDDPGALVGAASERGLASALTTLHRVTLLLSRPIEAAPAAEAERFEELLGLLLEGFGADRAAMVLVDGGEQRLIARALRDGAPPVEISRAILEATLGGDSIVTMEEPGAHFDGSESLTRGVVKAVLCVPLMVSEQVLGVIYLDSVSQVGAFAPEDLRIVFCVAMLIAELYQRRRLDSAAARARRRFEAVIAFAPVGLFALDTDHRVSFWSDRSKALLGLGDDPGALPFAELLVSPRAAAAPLALANAGSFSGELRLRRGDGSSWLARVSLARPARPAEGIALIGSLTDISELEQLKAMLVANNKLATLGLLVAGVAHDLRNFLGSLMASAQAAEVSGQSVAELSAVTLETCEAAGELINALLDISREDRRPRPIDLGELIGDVLRLVGARLRGQEITVATRIAPCPPVTGRRGLLMDALLNLILNAMEAMPRGGALELRLAAAGDERVVLEVSDEGPGIAPGMESSLFDPLATSRPEAGGTGLGLYMVRHLVEAQGGQVEVDSRLGEGTTFRLRLPAYREGAPPAGAQPSIWMLGADDELWRLLLAAELPVARGPSGAVVEAIEAGSARLVIASEAPDEALERVRQAIAAAESDAAGHPPGLLRRELLPAGAGPERMIELAHRELLMQMERTEKIPPGAIGGR